jgi:hypothetical protein
MKEKKLQTIKRMNNFIGEKNEVGIMIYAYPLYNKNSILDFVRTFICGHRRKTYDKSIMELLGKNFFDVFDKYQIWQDDMGYYYINLYGYDGVSFSFNKSFTITEISYGRTHYGQELIEKAKNLAKSNHWGVEIHRSANMRGIYYTVSVSSFFLEKPYVVITSFSTFSGSREKEKIYV